MGAPENLSGSKPAGKAQSLRTSTVRAQRAQAQGSHLTPGHLSHQGPGARPTNGPGPCTTHRGDGLLTSTPCTRVSPAAADGGGTAPSLRSTPPPTDAVAKNDSCCRPGKRAEGSAASALKFEAGRGTPAPSLRAGAHSQLEGTPPTDGTQPSHRGELPISPRGVRSRRRQAGQDGPRNGNTLARPFSPGGERTEGAPRCRCRQATASLGMDA